MSTITNPVMLDETGQDIATSLQEIADAIVEGQREIIDDETTSTDSVWSSQKTSDEIDSNKVTVENVLNSTSITNALSANMGKSLNDTKVDKDTLFNNATEYTSEADLIAAAKAHPVLVFRASKTNIPTLPVSYAVGLSVRWGTSDKSANFIVFNNTVSSQVVATGCVTSSGTSIAWQKLVTEALAPKILDTGNIAGGGQASISIPSGGLARVSVFRQSVANAPALAYIDQWQGVSIVSNGVNAGISVSNNVLTIKNNSGAYVDYVVEQFVW